uniref:Uncharacterized protein n=1 Tax=Glossina palpalis gambiensis TaxID=67801 RepID=A0A1B0AY06_9MUSC
MVTKPKPLHLLVCKSRITLTDWTAPNGPNNCHKTFSSVSGKTNYLIRPADGKAPAAKRLVAAAAWGSIRDVIILPYGENNASKSGCDRFLGRPDTYKLAPFMDSELGRAYETLITLFCKPFSFKKKFAYTHTQIYVGYEPCCNAGFRALKEAGSTVTRT